MNGYCYFHYPAKADEAREARSRGGKREYQLDMQPYDPQTLEDVQKFIGETINDAHRGVVPPTLLSSLATAVSTLVKVIEQTDLEKRIEPWSSSELWYVHSLLDINLDEMISR